MSDYIEYQTITTSITLTKTEYIKLKEKLMLNELQYLKTDKRSGFRSIRAIFEVNIKKFIKE